MLPVHVLHEMLERRTVFWGSHDFVVGGYDTDRGESAAVLIQVCLVSADEDLIGRSQYEVDPYATILHCGWDEIVAKC
jgi:hypothetical protein